jgi:hypothetical protein
MCYVSPQKRTMRKEDVAANLSDIAFDFFYWFSRFEFSLKENGYLKSHVPGQNAEPGWNEFVTKWHAKYTVSNEAECLLASPPERQIVLAGNTLDWKPVELSDCKSDLAKVVRLVNTVRNNLFHGGKHGVASWDNPKRTEKLLVAGKAVLGQFAELASIEADYTRYY